ncbi:uncharacterized protein H6S33_010279 [Morchella sextelata]|uniref:uncharacterized protein n=1 Tax=Morchella sextelata TaxID=1174677 RepID=UPI001D03E7C1|nr:uncharacterized protein H6S33_010279 [Morchella sextelata]KAH0612227.1 hypothetical protein H6S33_010279 [Morchella sextelata]
MSSPPTQNLPHYQFEPHHPPGRFPLPYTPNPSTSLPLPPDRSALVRDIISLYAGNPSESAMRHYHENSIYDDPFSFCDTRYKIAGQWQEYTFKLVNITKVVDSLITLKLDPDEEKPMIRYHKDQWDEKDYDHEELGHVFKELNGNHLPKVTVPPESLKGSGDA